MSDGHLFRSCAFLAGLLILGATFLLWPLPGLGFILELPMGTVYAVERGSPADQAGLRVGDRIVRIYGYPWERVNTRLMLVPLPWITGTPTPMTTVRDGQTRDLVLHGGVPTLGLQMEKLLRAIIALTCWGTGYLLGTSPRATHRGLRWAGWFWVLLGGSLGLYQLTHITSYVLTVGVLWFQGTVLAPAAVAIHHWYPYRPMTSAEQQRTGQYLLGAILIAQLAAITVSLTSPATTVLYERLHTAVQLAYLVSLILSALILVRAYHTTVVAHLRRQIRLIGAACVLVGCWWVLLLLLSWGNPTLQALVPPVAFPFGVILIPLAYLLGGVSADLMQLDQIVRRVLVHALTSLIALAALLVGVQSGLLVLTPALVVIIFLALYGPLYQVIQRHVVPHPVQRGTYTILHDTMAELGTSLDAMQLLCMLRDGIRQTFVDPPLAMYHRSDRDITTVTQVVGCGLTVPPQVDGKLLDSWAEHGTVLLPASAIQHRLGQQQLDPPTATLVFHPAILLWGVLRHQRGDLLGLILLGPRGDDDPYQPEDVRALAQLLGTAALALTNSASYSAQVTARARLRELYRHAQQIEERTAVEIANEIHDEVLNVHLRVNMELLDTLLQEVADPHIQERLRMVLAGEETTSQMLRLICEQLKPTGIDDPLGLAANLRQQVDRVRARWGRPVTLQVVHAPRPVDEQVHRALVRITREALTNAVKHSDAATITVVLCFPVREADPLVLHIGNDGTPLTQPVVPRPGHWGVRNMREYAEAIGATITWVHPAEGGTWVTVRVPAELITPGSQAVPPGAPGSSLIGGWDDGDAPDPDIPIDPDTSVDTKEFPQ